MTKRKIAKQGNEMSALSSSLAAFNLGQRVRTSFGTGIISAINHIDSIIYVTLSRRAASLYLFRPEQLEAIKSADEASDDLKSRP